MSDKRSAKRKRVEAKSVDANEAITFELLSCDITYKFKPLMSHQLFGDEETILGHKNASARVIIQHDSFRNCIEFGSDQQAPGATKVKEILESNFEEGRVESRQNFTISSSTVTLSHESLGEAVVHRPNGNRSTLSIYQYALSQASEQVKAIHRRAQQLLPFFIDGATPIDQSEPEWDVYLAVQDNSNRGPPLLVGFCTVYRIYAYPESCRLRVSQLLVLPPFQRQGIGRSLLEAIYRVADKTNAQDVIYEDPTEEVQSMRETIELERHRLAPWLEELAVHQAESAAATNCSTSVQVPTSLALSTEDILRAQKQLRVPKQQVRILWEGLLIRQKAFQSEPGQYTLRGLVARRLVGKFSDTEKQAVGKQIFTSSDGNSFCMQKVPRSAGIKGAPVALEDKKEEGESKEEREKALDQAVEHRMEVLARLAGLTE